MIGTIINNSWRVVRLIGDGGMGAVYEARHLHLGTARAVKVLLPQWAGNVQLLQRFFNEARATAALNHKNIIAVHDYGALPDGTQFIMMDLLEGCTLGALLRKHGGPLPLDRALRIITQIALALTAAHQRGIAHRDLKPENVFLTTRDGEPDHVVLLDFGIAKLLKVEKGMTQTNVVIGTPSYMPPEQLRGTKDVDHRVDIFALGAIAYLTVTGFMAFQKPGETLEDYFGLSTVELHVRQVSDGLIDPRTRNRALPDDWATGIMSALHKDPSRRMRLDELIVLFKRSTPNGHQIVEDCAKDLLVQAALGETMRAGGTPEPSERVTVQLKPGQPGMPSAPSAPRAVPAPPQAGLAPHVAATHAAPQVWAPQPPPSGPETRTMPPRAEAAPMFAISGPVSRSTLSGAASEAMPAARLRRRWSLAVVAVAVAAAAVVGVVIVNNRGARSDVANTGSATEPATAARAINADAAAPVDAATAVAVVAVDASIEPTTAEAPPTAATAQGSAKSSVPTDIREPAPPAGAHGSKPKTAVKTPREMGEMRVIVETTYAEVYVDGKHVGSTPWAGKLTTGIHTVSLRNDDTKRRETFKVTVSASKPLIIEKPW